MQLSLRRVLGMGAARADAAESRRDKWVVEPRRPGFIAEVVEIWRYRRTLWFLVNQSRSFFYRRMSLGVFWLFARPLLPLFFNTLIFGGLLGIGSDGLPYFLFFLTGSVTWHLFEHGVLWTTRSLAMNKSLVKKVYFPRVIVPIAAVSPAVVEAGIYLALLICTLVYYRVTMGRWFVVLGPGLLMALLSAVLTTVLAVSIGLFTSPLQAKHRDVRYSLRYFLRFWSYATPLLYPMSQVPERYHWIVYANPMASFVQAFKWGVLGVDAFPLVPFLIATAVTFVAFGLGFWSFGRVESAAVDSL